MDSVIKHDLRVEKTLDAIHATFEAMLLEKPYSKITVTALCQLARINKKTFYRYYPTLDDLRSELIDRYAKPYAAMTAGLCYPEDLEKVTLTFLRFSAEQGELYDAIVCNTMHEQILNDIVDGMERERYAVSNPPAGWTEAEWRLYMTHVTSTQLLIYRQWVKDGRVVSLDRMLEIGVSLVCKGGEAVTL